MTNNSHNLGKKGEEMAKKHLMKAGYTILETNWRFKKYEVDIIAQINKIIVFVEVKARKNDTFGEPEVFVTKQKQQFLIAAAQHYLVENNMDFEARFDIIAILLRNGKHELNHIPGAFVPGVKKYN